MSVESINTKLGLPTHLSLDLHTMNCQRYLIGNVLVFTPHLYLIEQHDRPNPREIQLSQKESQLLDYLCLHTGHVLARTDIIAELWNDSESSDIGLNKNILTIRRKLESLGMPNAIRTIPRVGYSMALDVLTLEEESPAQMAVLIDPAPEQTQPHNEESTTEPVPVPAWRRYWLVALLLGCGLLLSAGAMFVFAPHHPGEAMLEHLRQIYTPHGIIYRNDRTTQAIPVTSLNTLDEQVAKIEGGEYRMMISDRMISLTLYAGEQELWEKAFFIEEKMPLLPQLRCVIDNMSPPANAPSYTPSPGIFFNVTHFYAPCVNGTVLVGTAQITHTGFGRGSHGGTQRVELWNPRNQLVSSFQRLVHQQTPFQCEGYPDRDLVTLSVQSLNIEVLQQPDLESEFWLSEILMEYAHIGEIHYTTLQPNIRLQLADLFGGMLVPVNVIPSKK